MNYSTNNSLFDTPQLPAITTQQFWVGIIAAAGIGVAVLTASAFIYLLCKKMVRDCQQRTAVDRPAVIVPAFRLQT
ncbi:MAG: hypothetical protein P1U40_14145 [Coxiellaceae bacterium]|nr:hypothetical protein [Coxiellaceae bacterium]